MPDNAEFYKGLRIKNGRAAGDEKLLIVSRTLKEDHPNIIYAKFGFVGDVL